MPRRGEVSASTKTTDMRSRRFRWVLALMVLCLLSACASALAFEGQTGGGKVVDESPKHLHLQMLETSLSDVLRTGEVPFHCGQPSEEVPDEGGGTIFVPQVDCRIKAKLTVPAKVANWLGLGSTVIASGVAGDMVEHFKTQYDGDAGRTYFLKIDNIGALRAKFKRKRVHALMGDVSGFATDANGKQVLCESGKPVKSCPVIGEGPHRGFEWQDENALVCWVFRSGLWVGVSPPHYGARCPKPI